VCECVRVCGGFNFVLGLKMKMMRSLGVLVLLSAALVCAVVNAADVSVLRESMPDRMGFVAHSKPHTNTTHEIIFALKQLNLDVLEHEVLERATPGTSKYQQWMSFEEVGALIRNPAAYEAVSGWLTANGIKVC
jgi:hypothetical protein